MVALRLVGSVIVVGAVSALFAACGDSPNTIIIICDDAGMCPFGAGGVNTGAGGTVDPGAGGSVDPGSGGDSSGGSPPGSGGSPPGSGGSPPGSGGSPPGSGGTPPGSGGSPPGSGGAPPGSTFFDNFDDGNADGWSTDNVGPVGTPPGIWSVIGGVFNQSVAPIDESTSRIAYVSGTWTDMTVEARARMNSLGGDTSSYYVGVCGRYLDNNNYYCAALRSDGRFSLRARINGNTETKGDQVEVLPAVTTGVWYTVKLQFQGSTVMGYLDGALLTTFVDGAPPSGGIALITAGTTADYDDVTVTVP
jgi:Concanavalin A-like lectin/glucanases superfamily